MVLKIKQDINAITRYFQLYLHASDVMLQTLSHNF